MDAEAVAVYAYQTHVMPGLLQTPDYAHALFARRMANADEVEERVRARMSRQRRFLAPNGGPTYIAVLDESCLRNVVGSPAVMRDQCEHLLTVGQLPNIRIQIVPANRPDLDRPDTSLSLITLPDGDKWVYSESLDRGHFNDDPAVYAGHSQTYDVLRADSPSARESAALSAVHAAVPGGPPCFVSTSPTCPYDEGRFRVTYVTRNRPRGWCAALSRRRRTSACRSRRCSRRSS
jgi:hypothetical protein